MSDTKQLLLEALQTAIDPDKIWTVNAMAQVTIKKSDGAFRKTAVSPGDPPMFLTGVRTGKKAEFIFQFEPADTRPYQMIELLEDQAMKLLAGFEDRIIQALGFNRSAVLDANGNVVKDGLSVNEMPTSFVQARALFKRNTERRAKAEKAEAEKAAATRHHTNPLWGAFA